MEFRRYYTSNIQYPEHGRSQEFDGVGALIANNKK